MNGTAANPVRISVKLFPLKPYQTAIFHNPARLSVCEASTKAGKSLGALHFLLSASLEDKAPASRLYLSYVYPQAKKMFKRLGRMLIRADPGRTWWDYNKTDLYFRIKHGSFDSLIYFMGSDNFDAIYGSDYAGVIVDEASRMREDVWPAVRSTVTATGGCIRVIGNVKGRKNWAYKLARKAEVGAEGMAYSKITAADAVREGVFTQADLDAARSDLPEAVFRELYYAEPSEDGSNPFGFEHIEKCVKPMSTEEPAFWGVDLARKRDWTVLVGLDAYGCVCRFERWQNESWGRTEQRIIAAVGEGSGYVDSTGVGDVVFERVSASCPGLQGYLFTSRSKQQLMEGLAVAVQNGSVGFPEGPIKNEMDSFEFVHTRTGAQYSAPDGMHDDCVVALALAQAASGVGRGVNRVQVGWLGRERAEGADAVESLTDRYRQFRVDPDWGF